MKGFSAKTMQGAQWQFRYTWIPLAIPFLACADDLIHYKTNQTLQDDDIGVSFVLY